MSVPVNTKPNIFYSSKEYLATVTGTETLADGFYGTVILNSATPFTLTLGTAANNNERRVKFINIGAGTVIISDGGTVLTLAQNKTGVATCNGSDWYSGAETGDVTSSAVITEHSIVRGDGGAKGVQDSGIIIDDSDNVSNMGTLGCNEITIADGHGLNLQEDITFTGATGENLIKVPDNLAEALIIAEGANKYMRIVTTNGSECVEMLVNLLTALINTGTVNLAGATSGLITIQPKADAGTFTLTLPDSDGGANQVLQTDGGGNLSWVDQPAGATADKYATSIGDGVNTAYTVTHSLSTRDVIVEVHEIASPYARVYPQIEHTTTDTVTITFADAPTSNQYRVTVMG
jgi:hypothetical protein